MPFLDRARICPSTLQRGNDFPVGSLCHSLILSFIIGFGLASYQKADYINEAGELLPFPAIVWGLKNSQAIPLATGFDRAAHSALCVTIPVCYSSRR